MASEDCNIYVIFDTSILMQDNFKSLCKVSLLPSAIDYGIKFIVPYEVVLELFHHIYRSIQAENAVYNLPNDNRNLRLKKKRAKCAIKILSRFIQAGVLQICNASGKNFICFDDWESADIYADSVLKVLCKSLSENHRGLILYVACMDISLAMSLIHDAKAKCFNGCHQFTVCKMEQYALKRV